MTAKIVIVSGACGTGKSAVSKFLAENSPCQRSVRIHTDDFYEYIKKGYMIHGMTRRATRMKLW